MIWSKIVRTFANLTQLCANFVLVLLKFLLITVDSFHGSYGLGSTAPMYVTCQPMRSQLCTALTNNDYKYNVLVT